MVSRVRRFEGNGLPTICDPWEIVPRLARIVGQGLPAISDGRPIFLRPLAIVGKALPSNGMPVLTKLEKLTIADNVLRGIPKRFAGVAKVRIGGVVYTPAKLAAVYERHVAALRKVDAARSAWRQAVAEERRLGKQAAVVTRYLKKHAFGHWGPEGCDDFSFPRPRKPGPKTVAAKLAGVQKRRRGK
jgi:hypothetical protein